MCTQNLAKNLCLVAVTVVVIVWFLGKIDEIDKYDNPNETNTKDEQTNLPLFLFLFLSTLFFIQQN